MAEGFNPGPRRTERVTAGIPPDRYGDFVMEDDDQSLGGSSLKSNDSEIAKLRTERDKQLSDQKISFIQQRIDRLKRNQQEEAQLLNQLEELSLQKTEAEFAEKEANLNLEWNNWNDDLDAMDRRNPVTPLDQVRHPSNLASSISFGGHQFGTGMQSTPLSQPIPAPRRPPTPQPRRNVPPPNTQPVRVSFNPLAVSYQDRRGDDDGHDPSSRYSSSDHRRSEGSRGGNGLENPTHSGFGGNDPNLNKDREEPKHPGGSSSGGSPNDNNPHNFGIASMFASVASVLERLMEKSESPKSELQDKFLARQVFKYDLPQFNGNPLDWPMFKSAFDNTTRECVYNNVANLARLQRSLKGEAIKLVRGMMTSPDNVPTILSKLEKTYGRPELVVEILIQDAQAVSCAREDKMESLMEFEAAVTSLVTTIHSMKADEYLKNPLLVKELEKKLSSHLKLDWAKFASANSRTLTEFSKWISSILEVMQPLHTPKIQSEKKAEADGKKDKKKDKKQVLVTTESIPPDKQQQQQKSQKKNSSSSGKDSNGCAFCEDKEHRISKCPEFLQLDVSERKRWTIDQKRCLNCLAAKHFVKECSVKTRCQAEDCGKKHHTLIHGAQLRNEPEKSESPAIVSNESSSSEVRIEQVHLTQRDRIQYKVVPVEIIGPGKKVRKIYAMLDDCSGFTMIERALAVELGLKGKKETIRMKAVGGNVLSETTSTLRLTLRNMMTGEEFKLDEVNTFENLELDGGSFSKSDQEKYPHLRDLDLDIYTNVRPQMLIGLMHADLITPSKIVMSEKPNQPIAGLTKLGWVVYGRMPHLPKKLPVVRSVHHLEADIVPDLHQVVKQFFSTEDFGVKVCPNPQSMDEARAEEVVTRTLRRVGERFEVGLLWRNDHTILPSSREAALSRLKNMERKMDRNPVFAEQYCKKFQHYIDSNYVEKIPPAEIPSQSTRVWYLPHFAVFKADKPYKPRLVFDAAAMVNKISLNSCLLKGPDELTPLHDVLCKFRERKVAISADIREMFHQVLIKMDDRDSQRFLWRGMDRNHPPEEFRMRVMTFGATCSPFCAQRVKNVNAEEWRQKFPRAADAIVHRHYVDNYLDSVDTEEEAIQLQQEVFQVHKAGGYHICAWVSNRKLVLSSIQQELRSENQKLFSQKDELEQEKILGLLWDPNEDKFKFALSFSKVNPAILRGDIPTKRQALALTMSLFDPLGFAALLTVRGKILLKKAWKHGVGWDEELPDDMHGEWRRWMKEVLAMNTFQVPRCYSPQFSTSPNVELHIFCDSSTLSFAAVGYWRIQIGSKYHVSFVEAKTRVTPVKPLSMPRCELQGAIMACRLKASIIKAHTVKPIRVIFWTDSECVMKYLRMDGTRFHQFVACRVGELQESTQATDWRWISTKDNVADEATRIDKKIDVTPGSRWLNGPPFLRQPESQWPAQPMHLREPTPEELELKKEFVGATVTTNDYFPLLNPCNYSSWIRLIRVTAWCQRVYAKLKPKHLVLKPEDITAAEVWWWKEVQQQAYARELTILRSGKEITGGELRRYSPILDSNGIMRMQSRLRAANMIGIAVLDPVILPAKHPYTRLLIRHHHNMANHCGIDRVVNELKIQFAIPVLRAQVRAAWHECQKCRNQRAKPVAPKMGVLPTARLQTYQRPFTFTGMDYFGPIDVTVKRSREKRYGALFTCLVTRAVHIELASSLETDTCISAMRRFFAIRGQPKEIWSDNGTNFLGAEKELREELAKLDPTVTENRLATLGISWHFNPPHAPHMGGSWERMVQSIKKALYATLKERAPKEETLRTLLAEAVYSVNCHPLAYVSEDPQSPEVLIPNHFLLGPNYKMLPPAQLSDRDLIPGKQWKIAQRLADHFWNRWIKEILPSLAQRSKWFNSQKPLQVEDVVLLVDENQPRSHWKMGRVIQVPETKDGQTRWAVVKTADSQYKRPAVKLVVLDVGARGEQAPSPKTVLFLHDTGDLKICPKSRLPLGFHQELQELRSSGKYEAIKQDYSAYHRSVRFTSSVVNAN